MKKIRLFIYMFLLTIAISFVKINVSASSQEVINLQSLHEQTLRTSYVNENASITILTPGQGGDESNYTNYNGTFLYDNSSLVESIRNRYNGDVYLARMSSSNCNDSTSFKDFTLYLCERGLRIDESNYYNYVLTEVTSIQNYDKHSIILFSPYFANEYHNIAYSELESFIDSILYDYLINIGRIPKVNLIGHSRGGLLNLMYATNHPYNVCSMISIGTPYSGSALGQLNALVNAVGLSAALKCHSGKDILNVSIQNELRNNWNQMINSTPDANINALAVGCCTSSDFLDRLFSEGYVNNTLNQILEIDESDSAFLRKLKVFICNLANNLFSYINEHPEIAHATLRILDLGITISNCFSPETTAEEIQKIQVVLNNCYLDYGMLIIYDDLFIDYQSQTAVGYNCFNRVKKIFMADNTNYTKVSSNSVPIPHNLESRDDEVISLILAQITCGSSATNMGDVLLDQTIGIPSNGNAVKYTFTPTISTKYKFNSTHPVNILVYNKITSTKNCYNSSDVIELDSNVEYELYIYSSEQYSGNLFSISFSTLEDFINTDKVLDAEGFIFLKFQKTDNFILKLNSNNDSIKIEIYDSSFNSLINGNSEIVFRTVGNTKYYIKLYNTSTSIQFFNISQNDIDLISFDTQFSTTINNNYSYYKFIAPSNNTFIFDLFSSINNEYVMEIEFYSSDLSLLSNCETINAKDKTLYSISLTSGQIIYIGIRNTINATDQIIIETKTSNYYWKINGIISTDRIVTMNRSGNDKIIVSYYCNDYQLKGNIKFLLGSSQYFIKTPIVGDYEYELTLKNNANLNLDGSTYLSIIFEACVGDPSYVTQELYISVDPYIEVDLNDTSDMYDYSVVIDFNSASKKSDEIIEITLQMKNKLNQMIYQTFTLAQFNKAQFIPDSNSFRVGDLEFTLYSVKYMVNMVSKTYYVSTNSSIFHIEESRVIKKGLIENGDGTSTSPYEITSFRELNNIRKMSMYDHYYESYYIMGQYILMNDIECVGNWDPIALPFKGKLYGNNKVISNVTMVINSAVCHYGLFGKIENALIKDLTISSVTVSSGNNNKIVNIGGISGSATNSKIQGCKVISGNLCHIYNNYRSKVGGLVGNSITTEYTDCISGSEDSVGSLKLYGYGTIGGITGYMYGGEIDNCENYANLYYKWDGRNNMYTGGLVGKANFDTIISGSNYGLIKYDCAKSDSEELAPYMGQIIGCKDSTVECIGCLCSGSCDYSNLRKVGTILGMGGTNQARYASKGECGYVE